MEKTEILKQYHLLAEKEIKNKKQRKQILIFNIIAFLLFILGNILFLKIYSGKMTVDIGIYMSVLVFYIVICFNLPKVLHFPWGKLNSEKIRNMTKALILKDIQDLPTNIKEAEKRIEEERNIWKELGEKLELLQIFAKEL